MGYMMLVQNDFCTTLSEKCTLLMCLSLPRSHISKQIKPRRISFPASSSARVLDILKAAKSCTSGRWLSSRRPSRLPLLLHTESSVRPRAQNHHISRLFPASFSALRLSVSGIVVLVYRRLSQFNSFLCYYPARLSCV